MGAAEMIDYPKVDKDGTLWIDCVRKGDEVHLVCNGHAFAVCKTRDGQAVVQLIDVDTGVRHEEDIRLLCWRR